MSELQWVRDMLGGEFDNRECRTCGGETRGWSRDGIPECSACRLKWAQTQPCANCGKRMGGHGDDFAFCAECSLDLFGGPW